MRILLTNLGDSEASRIKYNKLSIPINIRILAAITPDDFSVDVVDACMDKDINFDDNYGLIGLSCTTRYALETYKIADEFRKRGKKVVIGGWHASALPQEAKQHSDAVVIGEAENTWPILLNDFKNNNLKSFYRPDKAVYPKSIPILETNELQSVQATRGCPYGCEFCSITHTKFRNKFRTRPIEDVIKEIESINSKYFVFLDNSLTIDTKYTKQLLKEIKPLGKKFGANGNINILSKDEELLKAAQDAGCISWCIGFESICSGSLHEISKKTNRVEDYKPGVKKIHDYGMGVTGSFVFGFDHDTKDVFKNTLNAIDDIGIDNPDTTILTPYPGTPLYKRLNEENRILTKDWSKYTDENVVFQPKNMTAEELFNYTKQLHDDLYTSKRILKRTTKALKLGMIPWSIIRKRNRQLKKVFFG